MLVKVKHDERTQVIYQIVKSVCKTQGSEGAVVYGVRAYCGDDYAEFDDISPDINIVEKLFNRLISGGVMPDQVGYIVEDYLEDICSAVT